MTCPRYTPPGFRPCCRKPEHDGACAHWNACTHDHGDGTLKRELRHIKDHWLSCLGCCLAIHLALDLIHFIIGIIP